MKKWHTKDNYWRRTPTATSREEKFLEWPVGKGDRIVYLIKNRKTVIELWNDRFNFDYIIKLYKETKKKNRKIKK